MNYYGFGDEDKKVDLYSRSGSLSKLFKDEEGERKNQLGEGKMDYVNYKREKEDLEKDIKKIESTNPTWLDGAGRKDVILYHRRKELEWLKEKYNAECERDNRKRERVKAIREFNEEKNTEVLPQEDYSGRAAVKADKTADLYYRARDEYNKHPEALKSAADDLIKTNKQGKAQPYDTPEFYATKRILRINEENKQLDRKTVKKLEKIATIKREN